MEPLPSGTVTSCPSGHRSGWWEVGVPSGHRSVQCWLAQHTGEVEVAVVDDLAVEGDDDDFLGADFDDGGDVLVGLVLGDGDAFAE